MVKVVPVYVALGEGLTAPAQVVKGFPVANSVQVVTANGQNCISYLTKTDDRVTSTEPCQFGRWEVGKTYPNPGDSVGANIGSYFYAGKRYVLTGTCYAG